MNNQEIGVVTIDYNEEGVAIHSLFEPTLKIKGGMSLLEQMEALTATQDPEIIKSNADLVFGNWFNKLSEIELADRDTHEVVSELVECDKYPSGNIKKCVLKYIFRELVTA